MDKYIKNVYKALGCSKDEKERIIKDLKSDIMIALENGEKIEDIKIRLGTPQEYAKEFNDNLGVVKKSHYKIIIGLLVAVILVIACYFGYRYLSTPKTIPISESKIFDEEKVMSSSKQIIELVNQKNYQEVKSLCSDILKPAFNGEGFEDALKQLGDLGEYQKISEYQFVEYKDKGQTVAVGDIVTLYQKRTVIYRLTFDKDMKLDGIYLR
ncbi:MAG: DUF3887 domain-containing protein [Coprobacillus sp.]